MPPDHSLPSVNDVFRSLCHIHDSLDWPILDKAAAFVGEECATIEVRLQVVSEHDWAVHHGDPSYDQDHHGHWGASAISKESDETFLRATAEELLDQVKEDIALRGDE